MEPAVCPVCYSTPKHKGDGQWIEFADYSKAEDLALTHPQGLKYFCGKHVEQADALRALPFERALLILKEQFPPESSNNISETQSWWARQRSRWGK